MERYRFPMIAALVLVGVLALVAVARNGRQAPPKREEPQVIVIQEDGSRQTLPMERYIMGVVGGEMGRLPTENGAAADWPPAAYAAQAILARTFALRYLEGRQTNEIPSDVTEAQAYRPENITPTIEAAVEETRGQVMLHEGEFTRSWFHSYAGGRTATAEEGLNYQEDEPPYIVSRGMPENEYVPEDAAAWSERIPLSRVREALEEAGVHVGAVREMAIEARGPSGRATRISVTGSNGAGEVHAADFRLALGPELMRSTLLDEFEVDGEHLVMAGRGYGHGVGLSQWDAYMFAREGRSAEEILHAFFDGVVIHRLWD